MNLFEAWKSNIDVNEHQIIQAIHSKKSGRTRPFVFSVYFFPAYFKDKLGLAEFRLS